MPFLAHIAPDAATKCLDGPVRWTHVALLLFVYLIIEVGVR